MTHHAPNFGKKGGGGKGSCGGATGLLATCLRPAAPARRSLPLLLDDRPRLQLAEHQGAASHAHHNEGEQSIGEVVWQAVKAPGQEGRSHGSAVRHRGARTTGLQPGRPPELRRPELGQHGGSAGDQQANMFQPTPQVSSMPHGLDSLGGCEAVVEKIQAVRQHELGGLQHSRLNRHATQARHLRTANAGGGQQRQLVRWAAETRRPTAEQQCAQLHPFAAASRQPHILQYQGADGSTARANPSVLDANPAVLGALTWWSSVA